MGKVKKVDDVKEAENLPISDEQDIVDISTETEDEEVQEELVIEDEATTDEEPEVQTTFTDFAAEEMIDEEGSVENVSN